MLKAECSLIGFSLNEGHTSPDIPFIVKKKDKRMPINSVVLPVIKGLLKKNRKAE